MKLSYLRFAALTMLAALAAALSVATPARAAQAQTPCTAPADSARFVWPLKHTGRKLLAGRPLSIVAIGSSSTAGDGASSPAASYPSRLLVDLRMRFPFRPITMKNRGVGGTEIKDMLAKFDAEAAEDRPDLVLWQFGTNSLLRNRTITEAMLVIEQGMRKFKALNADLIVVNPQYAPKVLAKAQTEFMLGIIAEAANQSHVNVFDRFAVMRYWHVTQRIPFSTFLSPDELHMNDWSYACIAKLLGAAIAEAATRPAHTATSVSARNVP
ncbi:MAG TPA: SGNH/GDSL hydrolase family protein [Xanthobacteraceae bacterium]|nr:SGNH/GDSL hydrolase family protein [Xanthobacteraceae bacterium]